MTVKRAKRQKLPMIFELISTELEDSIIGDDTKNHVRTIKLKEGLVLTYDTCNVFDPIYKVFKGNELIYRNVDSKVEDMLEVRDLLISFFK